MGIDMIDPSPIIRGLARLFISRTLIIYITWYLVKNVVFSVHSSVCTWPRLEPLSPLSKFRPCPLATCLVLYGGYISRGFVLRDFYSEWQIKRPPTRNLFFSPENQQFMTPFHQHHPSGTWTLETWPHLARSSLYLNLEPSNYSE